MLSELLRTTTNIRVSFVVEEKFYHFASSRGTRFLRAILYTLCSYLPKV